MNMSLLNITLTLLKGFLVSLELAVGVLVLGTLAGFAVSILGATAPKPVRIVILAIVVFVRGVPLLIQVFATFYFLPLIGPTLSPFVTATVALSLFATVSISEIVRGSIITVASGQSQAARALGLGRLYTMALVIFPQALPTIIPSLIGQLIWLIKGTSIISLLGVPELMYTGHVIIERTLRGFEVMAIIWILYASVCYPLSVFGRYVEAKLQVPGHKSNEVISAGALAGERA